MKVWSVDAGSRTFVDQAFEQSDNFNATHAAASLALHGPAAMVRRKPATSARDASRAIGSPAQRLRSHRSNSRTDYGAK